MRFLESVTNNWHKVGDCKYSIALHNTGSTIGNHHIHSEVVVEGSGYAYKISNVNRSMSIILDLAEQSRNVKIVTPFNLDQR